MSFMLFRIILFLALVTLLTTGCNDTIDHHAALEQRIAMSDAMQRRAAVEELKQLGPLTDEQLAIVEQAMQDDDALVRRDATRLFIAQCSELPDGHERFASLASHSKDEACREMLAAAAVGRSFADDPQE
jgi:hypothetical protein